MKTLFSARARHDLEAIGDFIARDNPFRALSFVEELELHCQQLADFPEANPVFIKRSDYAIRRAVHGNYNVYYTLKPNQLIVIRILNAAMDQLRALGQRPQT